MRGQLEQSVIDIVMAIKAKNEEIKSNMKIMHDIDNKIRELNHDILNLNSKLEVACEQLNYAKKQNEINTKTFA